MARSCRSAPAIDAINGEFSRRTMSRVLAQPICRDALLLGKFLAGLVALAIGLVSLWFLVIGLGLLLLGLPSSTEETIRMLGFFVAILAYGGVWLTLAILFSVVFRAVRAVLVGPDAAGGDDHCRPAGHDLRPEPCLSPHLASARPGLAQHALCRERAGPAATRDPRPRPGALQPDPRRPARDSPPCRQSFLLIWPQLTGLVAGMILIFAIAYIVFQRQEIRA
jgi:ABC-2 type transport system permease protein